MRRIAPEIDALDQVVLFHISQARNQSSTADRKEARVQLHGPLWTTGEISRDEQGPLVADHLQCAGNRAAINFPSSHYDVSAFVA